jgi:hypothetical protein
MKRDDALFNWLQIQVVALARPDDRSAQETVAFFLELLQEDHQMTGLTFRREGAWYLLHGKAGAEEWEGRYAVETVDALLQAIESEPKYNL